MRNLLRIGVLIAVFLFSVSLSNAFAQQTNADNTGTGVLDQRIFLPMIQGGGVESGQQEVMAARGTNQLIIRYHDTVQAADADHTVQIDVLNEVAGTAFVFEREMADGAFVVRSSDWMSGTRLNDVVNSFLTLSEIDYAEPDYILQSMATPNDQRYSEQWHYFAPSSGNYGVNLPAAWDITTGSANVVIAVIDSGIRNHAELSGRIVQGYDFISDPLTANDGNGRDSDPSDPGNWVTAAESASGYFAGCSVHDSSWHGTHVAGTIAANSNNSIGVAGINWKSKILSSRVIGKCGGYTSDIADAIRWSAGLSVNGVPANANPARVLNLSLGGQNTCGTTMQNSINAAVGAGSVVVVSAGNDNADARNVSPANCSNVITVAATGSTGSRAYYSNYGSMVEISAPGGDSHLGKTVLSTLNSGITTPTADSYAFYQGTSMAAPHVAGVVSLMFSINPNLTPSQVISLLQTNATRFPAGSTCNTSTCGAGIVNAAASVAAAKALLGSPPGAFSKNSPGNGSAMQSGSTVISWGVSTGAIQYEYCVDIINNNVCDGSWVNNGTSTSANISNASAGSVYYWQVRASNSAGRVEANNNVWWSFTVQLAQPPVNFSKLSPYNNQSNVALTTKLSWTPSFGATYYQYCFDTVNNSSCDGTWINVGSNTQVSISGLTSKKTYYWQVRAGNTAGMADANSGSWWQFKTN